MDEPPETPKRVGYEAEGKNAASVFDALLPADARGPTPWELWERRTAQADRRDFVESDLEDEARRQRDAGR